MPFCPECKYEYRPGVGICPDCNQALVERLPTAGGAAIAPDDSWRAICRVQSEISSELARGALDSNNIPSIVMSSSFRAGGAGAGFPAGMAASGRGGNIIMVPREFREEASLVLEGVLGDDFEMLDSNT